MNKILVILLLISSFAWQIIVDEAIPREKWERPEVVYPEDNLFSEESFELGAMLFSEKLLSRDTSINCQSCHMNDAAFADHLTVGEGIRGRHVTRNSPTLFNVAFHPYFMIDGKFKSLEDQVLGPINDHREFDMNPQLVIERLRSLPIYNELSNKAYQKDIDIEVVQKSIANFQRELISDNSKFDQFQRGETNLSVQELQGWKLFNSSELNCIQCHNGYNFTNYAFENNGLYTTYQDSGRALITHSQEDLAKFKVPTLRNISVTYPYMHDGSIISLDEVITHYASGGKKHSSQSSLVSGFEITKQEQAALISFLYTLSEDRYLTD